MTPALTTLLVSVAWYVLSGLLGSVLGRWASIESWALANPKRALVYQILRKSGLDFKGLISAFKTFAESRSGFPPIVTVESKDENIPGFGVVTTQVTSKTTVAPEAK